MNIDLIDIGNGNYVSSGRIIAIVNPESAPVRRSIQDAKEERRLIDATFGKKTRSVIITDSDHLILVAMDAEVVLAHAKGQECKAEEDHCGV